MSKGKYFLHKQFVLHSLWSSESHELLLLKMINFETYLNTRLRTFQRSITGDKWWRVTKKGMEIIIEYNNLLFRRHRLPVSQNKWFRVVFFFGVWFMIRNDLSSISIRNEKKRHESIPKRVKGVCLCESSRIKKIYIWKMIQNEKHISISHWKNNKRIHWKPFTMHKILFCTSFLERMILLSN